MKRMARFARSALTLAAGLLTAVAATDCMNSGLKPDVFVHQQDPGLAGLPTDNPAATRAYLAGLTFDGAPITRSIRCHDDVTTIIRIHVERRAHYLDPNSAKQRGRIVARVVNAGPNRCRDLSLGVNETAYWWMGPHRNLALTTDFWRIPRESSGPIVHLAQTGATSPSADGQRSIGDAWISDSLRHGSGDDAGDVESPTFGHLSTWITCLGGCCESTGLVEAP